MGSAALAVLQCGFAEPDWGWPGNRGLPIGRIGQAWPTRWSITLIAHAAAAGALRSLGGALQQDLRESRCLPRNKVLGWGELVQGLLILAWLCNRLFACFFCHGDSCRCCLRSLGTVYFCGWAGRQVTAACAGLGLQMSAFFFGCSAPCGLLLPDLTCIVCRLFIWRALLLHGATLILDDRSLDCAFISIGLWWQFCMCWRLLKAGCIIPLWSGSLNRHVACWLLLWLLGRPRCCLLLCLAPVAATMSRLAAALRPGFRALISNCCCCSTCIFLCKSGPAVALPKSLFCLCCANCTPLLQLCQTAESLNSTGFMWMRTCVYSIKDMCLNPGLLSFPCLQQGQE